MKINPQQRFGGMTCLLATVIAMTCLTGCVGPKREVRSVPYQVVYAQDAPVIDGNTLGFAEYELYPEMIFMPSE